MLDKVSVIVYYLTVSSEDFLTIDDDNACIAPITTERHILEFFSKLKILLMVLDSGNKKEVNNAAPVPTSSEMRGTSRKLKTRGVATAISAVSMIPGPQATGAPTYVTAVPLTGLSLLKEDTEGVLIRGPLRTSYASAQNANSVVPQPMRTRAYCADPAEERGNAPILSEAWALAQNLDTDRQPIIHPTFIELAIYRRQHQQEYSSPFSTAFGSAPYSSTVGHFSFRLSRKEVPDDLAMAATSNPVDPEDHMVLTSTEIYSRAIELICRT
ncbi:hypothetical protein TNCV_509411 [Trichonephila clavipes]|nr:hypothetical protein TNCV_509411 [Trichonephila clavipes]